MSYAAPPISPAIDTGTKNVPFLPAIDINGDPRVVGANIDQGAYESGYNSLTLFYVTSNGDASHLTDSTVNCNTNSTTCTLREAIRRANLASAADIKFGLSSCTSSSIVLASPLPDITSHVTIEGYSQSGSVANSADGAFFAYLCVAIVDNGTGQAWALHVPSGATNALLDVSGLWFSGFSDAAIKLEDGAGKHAIWGNRFSPNPFFAASNNVDAIHVTGNGKATIGGFGAALATNLITGSNNTAITIDSSVGNSVVAGNLIGIDADGSSAAGNWDGVWVYNSPGNEILNNYIGNNQFGVTLWSANGSIVQGNYIGVALGGASEGNQHAGVYLTNGAQGNAIGPTGGASAGANYIDFNGGAGVALTSTAGAGNTIRANSIWDNTGLAIDLNNDGATANHAGAASGPNNLQNYPIVDHAYRTDNSEVVMGRLFTVSNPGYLLDFYYNDTCTTIGTPLRGDPHIYLGTALVDVSSFGLVYYTVTLSSPLNTGLALGYVSATATAPDGSTSEIGECMQETGDEIFRDGFDS